MFAWLAVGYLIVEDVVKNLSVGSVHFCRVTFNVYFSDTLGAMSESAAYDIERNVKAGCYGSP